VPVEYKLSAYDRYSFINSTKIDSFLFVMKLSAWELGTDSTLRSVITTGESWISSGVWDSTECIITLDDAALDSLSGKEIVVEFGVDPYAMKDGVSVGTAAAWLHFTHTRLYYALSESSSIPSTNTIEEDAKVFVSQNVLYVENSRAESTELKLYDTVGKLLKINQFDGTSANINLGDVSSGIYLVTLNDQQGIQSFKVYVK
jgi:hypothetical protein